MTSDPTTPDRDRRGADLLARIDELTSESKLADYPDGNGWRFLLLACKREVARLTRERDEARKAARWMLPFVALDGAGYGRVHEACQRWPWLEDMEAPE